MSFLSPVIFMHFQLQKTLQHLRKHALTRKYALTPICDRMFCSLSTEDQRKNAMKVFDRSAKLLQRERAAVMEDHEVYDYLKEEVGYRLADRILDIKKDFKDGLDLGCGKGFVARNIIDTSLERLHMGDLSPGLLRLAKEPAGVAVTKTVVDEEAALPFDSASFDLVLSNLSLHWVNDLPGCLAEVRRVLRPDGAFLASMFGGDTLYQLRSALVLAELEREGGFSSHVSPFTQIKDVGSLLNQAGFTMLTIDTEELVIRYPSAFELMWDLKGMAEGNASVNRKAHLHRDSMLAAAAIYQEMYGDGESVPATFQIIYMIGWNPDPTKAVSQSRPGSAQVSLKDIARLEELIAAHGLRGKVEFLHEMDRKDGEGGDDGETGGGADGGGEGGGADGGKGGGADGGGKGGKGPT